MSMAHTLFDEQKYAAQSLAEVCSTLAFMFLTAHDFSDRNLCVPHCSSLCLQNPENDNVARGTNYYFIILFSFWQKRPHGVMWSEDDIEDDRHEAGASVALMPHQAQCDARVETSV